LFATFFVELNHQRSGDALVQAFLLCGRPRADGDDAPRRTAFQNHDSQACEVWAASVKLLGGKWGELKLLRQQADQGDVPIPVTFGDLSRSASPYEWAALSQQLFQNKDTYRVLRLLNIQSDLKSNDVIKIPLRYGPEEAGALLCDMKMSDSGFQDRLLEMVRRVLGIWGSLTLFPGFPGEGSVSWRTVGFDKEPDPDFHGIQYVTLRPQLLSLRSFQPIQALPSDGDELLKRIA
jgi:hypothetical protein